jgi:RNA polymerase sigma factor (sigma-70 family)
MSEVTRILAAMERGDSHAADQLLPLLYDELRKLAAQKLAQEKPGQTLQATALVHEAYLRLVASPGPASPGSASPGTGSEGQSRRWDSRGHFFAAAAEAMRRILVERARHKRTHKRGGHSRRIDFDSLQAACEERSEELLALDQALAELEQHDAQAANLVKLRYFAGLTHQQAAETLGIGRRAADRLWALARAWLYQQIGQE